MWSRTTAAPARSRTGGLGSNWRGAGALLLLALGVGVVPADAQDPPRRDSLERRHRELGERFRERALQEGRTAFLFSSRPRLGVSLYDEQDPATDARGARIRDVMAGTPAEEAGLLAGDVIVSLDGHSLVQPLDDAEAEAGIDEDESVPTQRLVALVRGLEEGDTVDLSYLRDGESRSTRVVLRGGPGMWAFGGDGREALRFRMEELPRITPPDVRVAPDVHIRGMGPEGRFLGVWTRGAAGLELASMNEGLAAYFGTDRGVLVLDVDEESTLGLAPGDVVLTVGERAVEDPNHLRSILRSYRDDETIRFRVRRQGAERTVEGTMG